MKKKYKISLVSYLNTLPFIYGLKHGEIKDEIEIQTDYPSQCAAKLKNDEVDIGLVPVALLSELENYHIVSEFCIGSETYVDSVKLYSHVPLSQIQEIVLDYQSQTSVALVQILARNFWKIKPTFVPSVEGYENNIKKTTAAVVIGDRTFDMNGKFPYEYDLAYEWFKFTTLPFVFAVWVSKERITDEGFLLSFHESLAYGVNHIDEALLKSEHANANARDYLTNKISYFLDLKKTASLNLFLRLLDLLKQQS